MEINITQLISRETFSPWELCNSVANLGEDAANVTWRNSLAQAKEEPLVLTTQEEMDAFLSFVKESGGWTQEERDAWSEDEVRALFIQWVSGDIRECFGDNLPKDPKEWDWEDYEVESERGSVPSTLFFHADTGQLFFDLGM